jgi:hypothetical protein
LASSLLFYGFDMPKGPRGEKRPADVIGAAVMVVRHYYSKIGRSCRSWVTRVIDDWDGSSRNVRTASES